MGNTLKYLTAIAGALTPLLYIHGNTFWYGYLTGLGVPGNLFQISFEETLVQGYVAYSIIGFPHTLLIPVYLLLVFFAAHNANEISKVGWVKKVVLFFSTTDLTDDKEKGHPATEKTLEVSKKATLIAGVIALFLGVGLLVLVQMDKFGKSAGEGRVKNISDFSVNKIYLKNTNALIGELLLCSKEFCAIYNDNKTTIIPISSIEKIESKVGTK